MWKIYDINMIIFAKKKKLLEEHSHFRIIRKETPAGQQLSSLIFATHRMDYLCSRHSEIQNFHKRFFSLTNKENDWLFLCVAGIAA